MGEKLLIGTPRPTQPSVVGKNESEFRALPAEWEQVGRVPKPRNRCNEENACRVYLGARTITPDRFNEATAGDPNYASDGTYWEGNKIERKYDADRTVRA